MISHVSGTRMLTTRCKHFLRKLVAAAAVLSFSFTDISCDSAFGAPSEIRLPNTILWAWQRAEDLTQLDPHEFGVAYLACNLVLSGDMVRTHWRDQPLKLALETVIVPVIRIDIDRRHPPILSDEQADKIAAVMNRIAATPRAALVQIDFDALESERPFYRQLINRVRAALPSGMPLSITSLASWCLFDNWIKDLPVDETVPMMFSLGHDRQKVMQYFASHADFLVKSCCKSLGLSLEEPDVNQLMIPAARQRKIPVRVYVFTRTAWNDKKIEAVRSMLGKP